MAAICGLGVSGPAPTRDSSGALPSIATMLAALADYGCQQAHCATAGGGLGCRYDAGGSPLHRLDGTARRSPFGLAIVADVRLDDRAGLGEALGMPRQQAADLADAALVLQAYLRWGEACPNHVFGDFAFAIWDGRARSFFCARDHVGVRPFFYSAVGRHFAFASAVQGVLAGPGASSELDERSVAGYLTLPKPSRREHTLFADVRRLPPGHSLTVRLDGGPRAVRPDPRPVRYWRPERLAAKRASDAEAAEGFLHLFSAAVRARLRPGRVGVHVSGGLDSSSVAVLTARELHRQGRAPPVAFSWLAPPTPVRLADAVYANEHAALASALNWAAASCDGPLPLCYCTPRAAELAAGLSRDGALHPDLPDQTARRASLLGVRTILSGLGGDQAASIPYGYFEGLLLRGRWVRLLSEIRSLGDRWPRTLMRIALRLASPTVAARRKQWMRDFRRLVGGAGLPRTAVRNRRWLIDPGFARRVAAPSARLNRFTSVRSAQLQALHAPTLAELLECRAQDGAVAGTEFRFPLLDRRLLEFVLCLPPDRYRHGPWGRYLMRAALAAAHGPHGAVLPPDIAWGRKLPQTRAAWDCAHDGALTLIQHRLRTSTQQPSRAGYVDMARLSACLAQAPGERHKSMRAPLFRALSLLDFQ